VLVCMACLFVIVAYETGAAHVVRSALGLPSMEQVIQSGIHWGSSGVALPHGDRTLVFLITGQSNAGNYGRGTRQRSGHGIYNVYDRRLWLARDPLLGSDGLGISPWIPFAENLLRRGPARSIVLALAVRGGTNVSKWTQGAPMRAEVFERIADLRALGLTPDYVLWQQGESDSLPFHTSPEGYAGAVRGFVDSLRGAGISAPVLIAQATRNRYTGSYEPVRAAQIGLAEPSLGILRGPDADRLGPEFRYDGLHLSEAGIAAMARMWVDAVLEAAKTLHPGDSPQSR
jgi:hypothetical protein